MRRFLLIAACCVSLSAAAHPADETAPGTTLNDTGLGVVSFPTSTRSALAQQQFLRGMVLLHLFEYPSAEQAFIQARTLDPTFAMAYWGEAMTFTHPLWNQQDVARGQAALARLGPAPADRAARAGSPLERDWLAVADDLYGEGSKVERETARTTYAELLEIWHAADADLPGKAEATTWLASNQRGG